MIRAQRRRIDLAEIDKLRLQTFHLQTNGAAAGEGQRDRASRAVAFGEFDGKEVEQGIFVRRIKTAAFAGVDALEAQRRPAAPIVRTLAAGGVLAVRRIHPVEAIERHDEAAFARLPADIRGFDASILHMGGDDLDVVIVEGNELEFLHDRVLFPAIFCRETKNEVRGAQASAHRGMCEFGPIGQILLPVLFAFRTPVDRDGRLAGRTGRLGRRGWRRRRWRRRCRFGRRRLWSGGRRWRRWRRRCRFGHRRLWSRGWRWRRRRWWRGFHQRRLGSRGRRRRWRWRRGFRHCRTWTRRRSWRWGRRFHQRGRWLR